MAKGKISIHGGRAVQCRLKFKNPTVPLPRSLPACRVHISATVHGVAQLIRFLKLFHSFNFAVALGRTITGQGTGKDRDQRRQETQ